MSFKPTPENFRVEEQLLFEPSGSGDHLWITIQKRACDTLRARRILASRAGIPERDIGYAGLKDAAAVSTQTFSLPVAGVPHEPLVAALQAASDHRVRLLSWSLHAQRLRVGQIAANRFRARLRTCDGARIESALLAAARMGTPNAFGQQRFGQDGRNVERGRAFLAGELRVKRSHAKLFVSALQAAVFQRVLQVRAIAGIESCEGDVWATPGRRSQAWADRLQSAPDVTVQRRRGLLVPTAPLPGYRTRWSDGEAGSIERQAAIEVGWPEGLPRTVNGIRVDGNRRPLRVFPGKVSCTRGLAGVEVAFTLPAGSYGTVFLDRLLATPGDRFDPCRPIIP